MLRVGRSGYGVPLTSEALRGAVAFLPVVWNAVHLHQLGVVYIARKRLIDRVGPHTFRHSVGVQLVAAGVDATVIRNWLGHTRLDTTNLYARANLETKRKALEQVDPATKPSKPPRRKHDPELLTWLESL